jgi:eukaryotic-like serine/threonine-protein kinase
MQPGRQFGSYTIQSLIGAGGMGEVYRARDSKLGRDVALKVLPVSLAGEVDRLCRFEREALLLASLSHPNIAIIHGLEEVAGIRALVLELIEGPTLAERIAPGPIPLDETLAIARQIADALQSAHDNGVIHRDLKPANIKVRRDGTVKVLDFGLAKLTGQLAGTDGPRLSNSPTMVSSMPGLLLGTAAYMSPEQAKGQEADRRSDVWAFGCVLFEMLTGRAAFAGHSSTEVFANVLKTDPDWSRLPADTPAAIRRLLRRCLEKDDKRRVWDIADARLELDEAREESLAPRPSATRPHRAERLAWGSAVAGLALLAAMIGVRSVRPAPVGLEVRFDINTPPVADPEDFLSVAISPDGQTLLFVANSEGQPYLWVRALDSVVARPLPGTAGASLPFWSPDSRSVGFFADGQLKRLDLDGGLVRMLTQATFGRGGAWNRDGVILFAPNPAGPIFRLPADGGTPVRVTSLEAAHSGHSMPSFLPDGRHFLYIAAGTADSRGVYVGQLDAAPRRKLVDADNVGTYAAGHLLFVRKTTVFAQDFDVDRLEVRGSPFPVVEGVTAGNNSGSLSASVGGTIAVRVGLARARRQLAWFDRSGKEMETLGDIDSVSRAGFSPSPDGGQLAFIRRVETNPDIWLLETRRNLRTRFTSHPGEDIFPAWSRDGSRIVFSSNRDGGFSLYQKRMSGNDDDELVLPGTPQETFASDTSPDGRLLLFQRRSVKTGWDVWSMPLRGAGQPERVVQTEFDERDALLSPDGKWLAYFANNSGHFEVYVQPFPGPGARQQVSTSGGVQMRWRPDGRELFYLALDRTLMAAPTQTAADGKSLTVGTPLPLFAARVGGLINPGPGAEYIVSADGKRFLMNTLVQESDANPIRLIVHWKARP